MIEIQVLRFDRETDKKPYFEKYKIEKDNKMKILDALIYINENYNANLGFRSSCRAGQCGSCGLNMDGEPVLACKNEIEDKSILEPLDFPVIKDFIVDKGEIESKVANMDLHLEKIENDSVNDLSETIATNTSMNTCACPSIIGSEECVDTKKVRSCIECHSCLSACPVIKMSENFAGPYFMRYFSKFDFDPRDTGERTKESIENGLYCCTSCGKCGEVCPKEINSFGDAIEKIRALAYMKDLGPLEAHKNVKEMIKDTGRSIEPVEEGFIEKINKIAKDKNDSSSNKKKKKEKIAIFTGCMVDYRLQSVGFALIDVLKENGIDANVPQGQVCCGSPLLRTGQTDIVEDLVNKNYEVFSEYDTIITVCAGCGATLKNDYPKYGINLNIVDISEFLANNLNTKNMKDLNLKVTYHDPCHLIRGQEIVNEPREIIKKIKGVEFVEMEKPDQCCGAGGGVRAGRPEIALGLGKKKASMIKKLGVDAVISICPFCQYNIQDALEKENLSDIKVMNILELLKMSYD
ncbi:MAG: succinate dehydrogenase/fumarate reductase iron-sulfur subunit [Methanobacteriaceae archaeon]|jgi:fumarate reductase (CoM/CoB) subunit B|nr:succinate dehydrogenase/fumarate reductase iron-sulfur subunit [Candidatus Methanorudis spinitermitis]